MLTTGNVPIPKVNTDFLYLTDFNSSVVTGLLTASSIATGDTVWSTKFNRNASYLDIISALGSGALAVANGLVPSAGTGLNASISAGSAIIGCPVQKKAATVVAVNASATNYIWLSQAGTFTVVANSITPPAGKQCYLGAAITSGSAVTSVDLAGVVYLLNGTVYRIVGDVGIPVDTPPATWRGLTETTTGVYYWNGTAFINFSVKTSYLAIVGAKSDADYTLIAGEYSIKTLKLAWTGWTGAHNVIVPTAVGEWYIINATGQAATIKTTAGTGIAIASTKTAKVLCDGTNVIRLTGDI
jgi:hypothetical protein